MTFTLTINGREVKAESGATILEAARSADIYIPGLCYYPGLKPLPEVTSDMSCQLCLVEVEGKIVLSCTTRAVEGMRVETETPRVKELRRRNLSDILRRQPDVCLSYQRPERRDPFDIPLGNVTDERCAFFQRTGFVSCKEH